MVERLWINAFSTIRPSDKTAAQIGHEILKMLRNSQESEERIKAREADPFEPIMAVDIRVVAS